MTEESRAPYKIEGYAIGDEGKPNHFNAATSREDATRDAASLRVGDAAFIRRSDLKWTYAKVTERTTDLPVITLRFEVDSSKNRKSFPENQWGKYIRTIKVTETATESPVPVSADEKSTESLNKTTISTQPSTAVSVESEKAASSVVLDEKKVKSEEMEETSVEADTAGTVVVKTKVEEIENVSATKDIPVQTSYQSPEPAAPQPLTAPTPANESKPSGGWLSSLFGGSKAAVTPKVKAASTPVPTPAADPIKPVLTTVRTVDTAAETTTNDTTAQVRKVEPEAPKNESPELSSTINTSTFKEETSKENDPEASMQLTQPRSFLPSPALTHQSPLTPKRNPSSILKFNFGKNKGSITPKQGDDTPKATNALSITIPHGTLTPKIASMNVPTPNDGVPKPLKGKEWFDPEACECDYDKNPTDIFQALEARQFDYVYELYRHQNERFTKECKTWVVAKGQKKDGPLRFRALPLHAAIVFGAPDDLLIKILRAYPKATRGRDVKGRLPIHLAFEHNASDEVLSLIVDAFPKGFFARDKKDLTPVDHINGNTTRAYFAKYIPQVLAAKVEEERETWVTETNMLLEHQKLVLREDEEFMADAIQNVQEEVEAHYMSKIELIEANYKKEIEMLKKKHDSETQALLEGFEVKLNFERKLNKLKATN